MLLLAYLAGAVVPPLDGVSAGYADIALGILEGGKWTQFMTQGQNYQGGPPLLFWLTALSFELFGVSVVAYKLPSLLFSALAVYSTVRLGILLYNETVARLAGVILASAFAFLFVNNIADMDALLIGAVIFATSQLFIFVTDENKLSARAHLVVAAAGLALGLAAMGLVGVVLPLAAVFLYLVYRLEWRRVFDPFWLTLPLFVLLFSSPLLYAYHAQFGLDNGLMQFVLWLQSAEQQTVRSVPGSEGKDLFFYYYTYLWAFLPWTALALWALVSGALQLVNDRYWPRAQGYAVTLGLIVGVFILLSLARFRLMHYIGVLLPFFALLLAGWLPARLRHPASLHKLWLVQYVAFALIVDAALVFNGWMFPLRDWAVGVVVAALLVLGIWGIPRWFGGSRLVIVSVSISAVFWLLANLSLSPRLLEYQAGTVLGNVVMERQLDRARNIYYLEGGGHTASFDVAIRRRVQTLTIDELAASDKPIMLFVTAGGHEMVLEKGLSFAVEAHSPDYSISRPGWKFLDPSTRPNEWRGAYLLLIRPQ
jgi:4-amino-4-deoxy-L-arabinose transferase-like glycosyltransferase